MANQLAPDFVLAKSKAIDGYFCEQLLPHDIALESALRNNASSDLDAIDVAPNQGKMLYLLAKMNRALRVLEVGTLGGYSSLWFAKAVGPRGKVVTLEIDPRHAQIARENISKAGCEEIVEVKIGPAVETLALMEEAGEEKFDMVFIDADKQNNVAYFQYALKLSHEGTLIVIDNVGRHGQLLDKDNDSPAVLGTRALFDYMAKETRIEATALQTIGSKGWDGIAMALVVA